MQPLADAMMALQTQKLAVGMQLQVRGPEVQQQQMCDIKSSMFQAGCVLRLVAIWYTQDCVSKSG